MSRLVKVFRETFSTGFQLVFTFVVCALWWFTPSRASFPLETAVVLLLVANLAVYWLEHRIPDHEAWTTSKADRKIDAFYVLMRVFVLGPVFQVAVILAVSPVLDEVGAPDVWPEQWPVVFRIAIVLFVAEAIAFSMHKAMHRVPFLWRFHATHHAQTKLTSARWSSGHPGEFALFQIPILIVIAVLNPADVVLAGAIVIGRTTTMLAHSNLPLRDGPLGWLLTTPRQHRRHHARERLHAANFGDVFILFDRILGSYCPKVADEVGVGDGRELTLTEQLLLPGRMYLLKPVGTVAREIAREIDGEIVVDLRAAASAERAPERRTA